MLNCEMATDGQGKDLDEGREINDPTKESLRQLIAQRPTIDSTATLEQVQNLFQSTPFKFLPVVNQGKWLGMISREHVGNLLGSRFGFSIMSRKPVGDCLLPQPVAVTVDQPTHLVLKQAFARPGEQFFEDIALLESDQSFIGLIEVHSLVKLQQRMMNAKFLQTAAQRSALLKKNHQLLEMSQEISAKNEQLAIAHQQALEATRLKGEFLANMSHEIRTPMNGVIGMTSLLMDTDLTQEQEYFATTIRSSAESLLTVVNDILDFSKIEAGKLEIQPAPFLLPQLIDSSVLVLAEKAAAKQLELFWHFDRDIPVNLLGDASRLRQILLNLLGNAVKFTDIGSVQLNVRLLSVNHSDYRLRFDIKDTGPGIPTASRKRLFNAFTQLDGSANKRHGGTGLGLSISKRLLDLMGGTIGYLPRPSGGSCFWFELAFRAVDHTPLPPLLKPDCKPLPVLIVIEHRVHGDNIAKQLAADGFDCCIRSSEQVLRTFSNEVARTDLPAPFSCIVLDLEVTGAEPLLLALRQAPHGNHLPILMLTRLGSPVDPAFTTQYNITQTCYKPLRFRELSGKIAELCHANSANPPYADQLGTVLRNIPADTSEVSLPPLRVLVAEDSLTNQQVVKLFLTKLGFTISVAANGIEAIAALQTSPFDVILMDCMMPDLDGYAATAQIRNGAAGQHAIHIPIIAMTANAMTGDREKCLACGMNDYLSKPLRRHELIAKLKTIQLAKLNHFEKPNSRQDS